MRLLLGVAVAALCAAPALSQQALTKKQREALALTPEHFETTATYKDDELETVAEVNTAGGFQDRGGLLRVVSNDNFLRAYIDKRTGATQFQVYQFVSYDGDWRFFYGVNYETTDGPRAVELIQIDRKVLTCGRYTGCSYIEHFAFPVEESLLREIAAKYDPANPSAWRFKFKSKSGKEWQDGMLPAEIAGLLRAVDRQKRILGLAEK